MIPSAPDELRDPAGQANSGLANDVAAAPGDLPLAERAVPVLQTGSEMAITLPAETGMVLRIEGPLPGSNR